MKKPARILYCHCANTHLVSDQARADVLRALEESGEPFLAVADLCERAAQGDPLLKKLAAGPVRIVACYPRAIRWLFAFGGAPLGKDAVIHNLRTQPAEEIIAALGMADAKAATKKPRGKTQPAVSAADLAPKPPGEWIPWFPTIDYDRCKGCRQCVAFCMFGTYAVTDEGRVRVAQPAKCKTNCPACARVCPESAIIFAKYKDGPIAGDEGRLAEPAQAGMKRDAAGVAQADVLEAIRRRNTRAKAAPSAGESGESSPR